MSRINTFAVARDLLSRGWVAERSMVEARDGGRRQGWKWTDPAGATCYSTGKWAYGPTKPRRTRMPADWHMVWRKVSPRNEIFIRGTLPAPCKACGRDTPERLLLTYHGVACCPACFERRAAAVVRETVRAATLAARARAFMESRSAVGRINIPEVVP
jgi:hypothetical protein